MDRQPPRAEAREPWLPPAARQSEAELESGRLAAAAPPPEPERRLAREGPEDAASFLSRYTFWWTLPSIQRGNANGRLTREDLPGLPGADDPGRLYFHAAAAWQRRGGDSVQIFRCLCWGISRRTFLSALFHGWTFLFLMSVDPLLLRVLLSTTGPEESAPGGLPLQLTLVLVLSLSMLVRVSCMEMCYFMSVRVMNNARSTLVHAIFRKALAVPDHHLDIGRITNLMATDADKIGKWSGLLFSTSQWTWAVVSLPVVVIFLYGLVGSAAFLGAAMIIGGSSLNRALGRCNQRRTKKLQECRDERSKLLCEMLRGIRTVKLEVWEHVWHRRISQAREREMQVLVRIRIIGALNGLVGDVTNMLIPVSIFAWYTLVEDKELDAATAFTTLAWISTLQWSISSLPGFFDMVANLKPTFDRVDKFLTEDTFGSGDGEEPPEDAPSDELRTTWHREPWLVCRDPDAETAGTESGGPAYGAPVLPHHPDMPAIEVAGAAFGYLPPGGTSCQGKIVLNGVGLEVRPGSFVMIAGPVGSGKSSLLASLAGARPALAGRCTVRGRRAFVPQKPFLLNATLRENVLFGLPMDAARYEDVVRTAALPEDLRALAAGDETVVGESGVQLSGGQKARVALARALYADADVLLLDDVLSAVDAHTGRFLWDTCLVGSLLRKGKTVVLVSHQVQYLSRPEVTSVVLLREGRVWLQGPWSELTSSSDALLAFVQAWNDEPADSEEAEPAESPLASPTESPRQTNGGAAAAAAARDAHLLSLEECQAAVVQSLQSLNGRCVDPRLVESVRRSLGGEAAALETVREGNISWADFEVYLRAFGSNASLVALGAAMVLAALSKIMSNLWLAKWTGGVKSGDDRHTQQAGVGVYALIGVATGCLGCTQACILTICALAASRAIHKLMLANVLGAPMSFFDVSPSGRVLNRFLQDMQNVDNFVPNAVATQITRTLDIATQLGLIYVEAPWVLLSLPVMIGPYWAIFRRMRVPNRDTRRIESAAHSPVYAHFGDTLRGRETIRAFAAEARFEKQNLQYIDAMAGALYGNNAIMKWAQALTAQWGCMLYFVCGFACVGLSRAGAMTTGQVGLVMLYAGQLQRALMDYMMSTADLENKFVSVERVAEYTRLDQEEASDNLASAAAGSACKEWPRSADIVMLDVAMRYRLSRALVLRGIDLQIRAGAKVALCGRTGCGKSSLFGALCRLYPIARGRVLLGGSDMAAVPLKALRTVVRVVSQDAFLISGTLRENLAMDRTGLVDDTVLWHCLEAVGMAAQIWRLPDGLGCQVEEDGRNFSVGERQLLTLARALVPTGECHQLSDWRPPHVLLCDEATASVDLVADEKVHEVVLSLQSTVVMICHRLQHVRRFSQVVVVDQGRVAEEGSPQDLLTRDPPSRLARLCAEAGVA